MNFSLGRGLEDGKKDNYKKLFYSTKKFEKQYGIDKSTLLEKYNYQEYINSKSIRNVI